ncbi:MAG: SsrA-binding protein SmpB [Anaeroplasmataceae bacterium]|nr:SsrA-binding protein SmpB [Anaeroplasmataceae bacterium]MDE5855577.1 SsrA-binding protein SmpB [Anaeroplasmataceae bacterium]MDE6241497.1 SsrA-binding protein SmpB [Anaeroplasmataceae bacterium]MDE7106425.1 SsrA-binding protein SmpB [Anaeroplasmataceae bacterium]
MKIVCTNKKAGFEYFILDKFEAGIKLTGTEIKSVRAGKCNINDAYVLIKNNKPYIINMNIAKYDQGNIFNHDEFRSRELLLHEHETVKLATKVKLEGLAIVALKAYFVGSLLKIEIALCKGKKLTDKRESLKEKDSKRRIEKALKDATRY